MDVFLGHPLQRKVFLGPLTASAPAQSRKLRHLARELSDVSIDESGHPVLEKFWNRAKGPRKYRRPAGQSFDHHEPEGLRPINRKAKPQRISQKLSFLGFGDLAEIFDKLPIDMGFDMRFVELLSPLSFDLRGDLKRDA